MNALKTWFFAFVFPWVPKRLLSRGVGVLMRVPLPKPTRSLLLSGFARFFAIDVTAAEKPLIEYLSFDDFFTRKLKKELRPIESTIVHPADSAISQHGPITAGELIQAKGWTYSLAEFLGDAKEARLYNQGSFTTYYLCPADYHRVHAPCEGDLVSAQHIPGLLWPVNSWSVNNIKRLFCLNERVVLNFRSKHGPWSLVLVGATNVGHMTMTLDPSIITNRWLWHAPTSRHYDPQIKVQAGDELGIFHLGSTAIWVRSSTFPSLKTPTPSQNVKVGQGAI